MPAGIILYIENCPEDRELMTRMLGRLHVRNQMEFARDGEEAVHYLLGSGQYGDRNLFPFPNLVLLDIGLPIFDGFELLHFIRDNDTLRRLPVIMLSNSDAPQDKARASELGADGYLTKTSSLERLQASLKSVNSTVLSQAHPDAIIEFSSPEPVLARNSNAAR